MKESGIGAASLLGIAFVILKLTNFIDWSWWWVTILFWAPLAFAISIYLILGIIYMTVKKKNIHKAKTSIRKSKFQTKLDAMIEEKNNSVNQ